jgi:hypothetical protein
LRSFASAFARALNREDSPGASVKGSAWSPAKGPSKIGRCSPPAET